MAYIVDLGLPSELRTNPEGPHCLHVTWKRAVSGSVTGYNIYCFPGDSQKAEIIQHISDVNQESAFISGLKPDQIYRVGITSVYSGTESKQLFSEESLRMRKSMIKARVIYMILDTLEKIYLLNTVILAEIHHLILNQNRLALVKNLIPDEMISKMLEKDSPMEQYVLSTDNQEERIQRFIECLQQCSLEDYKHFIELLYKTQQGSLATKISASCKSVSLVV